MQRSPRIAGVMFASCCLGVLASGVLAPVAAAQARESFSLDDLRRVEAARDAALQRLKTFESSQARAERDAAQIDADLIAAATDSRRREAAASQAEARLAELAIEADAARARLFDNETSLSDILAALMAFDRRRPPALTTSPESTGDAVRAAILMSEAAPALAARAADIRARIIAVNTAVEGIRREQETLDGLEKALAARREEIEALASEKRLTRTALAAETATLRTETRRLASEADTLRDLLDGLARSAPSAPGRKPAPAAAASTARAPVAAPLPRSGAAPAPRPAAPAAAAIPPAVGRTLVRFGESIAGERQSGMTIATRSGAQVVAPQDARVEFAGVFRTYGQMLILDMGGDILVIVSGLDALYAEAGQWVLAGEPIGRMAAGSRDAPELYLEVRRDGRSIDPATWLGRGA